MRIFLTFILLFAAFILPSRASASILLDQNPQAYNANGYSSSPGLDVYLSYADFASTTISGVVTRQADGSGYSGLYGLYPCYYYSSYGLECSYGQNLISSIVYGNSDAVDPPGVFVNYTFSSPYTVPVSQTKYFNGNFYNASALVFRFQPNGSYIRMYGESGTPCGSPPVSGAACVDGFKPFFRVYDQDGFTTTGHISTSTTLYAGYSYVISDILTIDSGSTLTIEPGAGVFFDTATSSGIVVNGNLIAEGTSDNITVFKPATSSPQKGDWLGIKVSSGGYASLKYVDAQYGGRNEMGFGAIIKNEGGLVEISSSTIGNSLNYGISNNSGTTTVDYSDIGANLEGIHTSGGYVSAYRFNSIHNNVNYGINNTTSSSVSAQYNFWGNSTGPYHSTNTSGAGDTVSDYVDFSNWLSGTHYVIPSNSSVQDNRIDFNLGTSTYGIEMDEAAGNWNSLGSVTIASTTSVPDTELIVYDFSRSDVVFVGQHAHSSFFPVTRDTLIINNYFMGSLSHDGKVHVLMHELGHALGLGHSLVGNIMERTANNQTAFGAQDLYDYYYLWP